MKKRRKNNSGAKAPYYAKLEMKTADKIKNIEAIKRENDLREKEWFEKDGDKMLAVFVDVYGDGQVKKVHIKNDLDEFYRLVESTTLDMPTLYIRGRRFVVICDDEGLFRRGYRVSAVDGMDIELVGNLIVVAFDESEEDIRGLTEDEADHVMKCLNHVICTYGDGSTDEWDILGNVRHY